MNFRLNIHSCVADIFLQDLVHMQLSVLMDCVWQVLMWWLIDTCQHPQDRERREDELNELRHILDENHSAVTAWESECRDKAKVQESWNTIQMPQVNTGATLRADLVSGLYSGSVTCVATAAQIHRCSRKSTPSSVCGEKTQKPKSSGSWRTVLWLFRWDQHSGSAFFILYSSQLCQYIFSFLVLMELNYFSWPVDKRTGLSLERGSRPQCCSAVSRNTPVSTESYPLQTQPGHRGAFEGKSYAEMFLWNSLLFQSI